MKRPAIPPPPKPPRPRKSEPLTEILVDFDFGPDEQSTLSKNERLVIYQRLLAILDNLFRTSKSGGIDLIEIGELFSDASEPERAEILRHARASVPRP